MCAGLRACVQGWRLEKGRERAHASCVSCHDRSARAKGSPLWLWRAIKSAFSAQQTFRDIRSTVGKRLPERPPTVHRPEVFSPVKNFQTRRSTWRTPVARLHRLRGARTRAHASTYAYEWWKELSESLAQDGVEKERGCTRERERERGGVKREGKRKRGETRRRRSCQQRKRWKGRRRGGRGGGGWRWR